ncbi:Down syndrome cell adhesion molecule-like protein Dscam2 [Nymphon striatum]|nr:Down syndrome cell adhesion molecule-like protein Dscam2 [Nymphon striatum]
MNTEGLKLQCSAHGEPDPEIQWLKRDGYQEEKLVTDIPSLLEIYNDGTLDLKPFAPEDFRQDIHSTVFRCIASNMHGRIISAPVSVRATTKQQQQQIQAQVYDEYVVAGNTAVLKCHIPAFYKDDLEVVSWIREDNKIITAESSDQNFEVTYSGNLHMKSVSSDRKLNLGFWCQMKNKITGETFLSQSAGKIIVTDPQGGVAPSPIEIFIKPSVQVVDSGSELKLKCHISGHPIKQIKWLLNGKKLDDKTHVSVKSDGTLFIKKSRRIDEGMYQCFVSNDWEQVQATAQVILGDLPPKLIDSFKSRTLQPGPSISLKCTASGRPTPNMIWKYNDQYLEENERYVFREKILGNGTVHSKVIIKSVRAIDGGEYTCMANNAVGNISHAGTINVYGLPMVHQMKNVTIAAGQDATIRCYVSGHPYNKNGIYSNLPKNMQSFNNGTLLIHNARKINGGNYSCLAKNGRGQEDKKSVFIKVFEKPVISGDEYDLVKLRENEPFSAMCGVNRGDEPIKITWKHNGNLIILKHGLDIATTKMYSVLQIRESKENQAGNYTCFAQNDAGYDTRTIELKLNCREVTSFIDENKNHILYENGTLMMKDINNTDAGKYSCIADNGIGKPIVKKITLSIKDIPVIKFLSISRTKTYGENIRIICKVSGHHLKSVHWFRNDDLILEQRERTTILKKNTVDGVQSTLSINSLVEKDGGRYKCSAQNNHGQSSKFMQLIIIPTKQVIDMTDMIESTTLNPQVSTKVYATDMARSELLLKFSINYISRSVQFTRIQRFKVQHQEIESESRHVYCSWSSSCNSFDSCDNYYCSLSCNQAQEHKAKPEMEKKYLDIVINSQQKSTTFNLRNKHRKYCQDFYQNSHNHSTVLSRSVIVQGKPVSTSMSLVWTLPQSNCCVSPKEDSHPIRQTKDYSGIDTLNRSIQGKNHDPSSTMERRYGQLERPLPLPNEDNYQDQYEIPDYYILLTSNCMSETQLTGPIFLKEPQSRKLEFLNEDGAKLHCSAHGKPYPEIQWFTQDRYEQHKPVSSIPSLVTILSNGTLELKKFLSHQFRQDVHATTYICIASNLHGKIVSIPVSVRASTKQQQQQIQAQVYDEYVVAGNIAVLKCHIPAFYKDDLEVVSWVREDNKIITRKNSDSNMMVTYNGNLHVQEAISDKNLELGFWCQIKNTVTGDTFLSQTAGRIILTDPQGGVAPVITDNLEVVSIEKGQSVRLPCAAQSSPSPRYKWISGTSTNVLSRKSSLLVLDTDKPGTYVYTCIAENKFGMDKRNTKLIIKAPLEVFIKPSIQVVDSGSEIGLKCIAHGHPIKTFKWTLNGIIIQNKKQHTLNIDSADRNDEGMYQCFVSNSWQEIQSTAQVILGGLAPTFIETFKSRTIQPGPSISLKCIATGRPTPDIIWGVNGKTIQNGGNYIVRDNKVKNGTNFSTLIVKNIRVGNGGEYYCSARNNLNISTFRGNINIYGLPVVHQMDNVTVAAGNDISVRCFVSGHPIKEIIWEKAKPAISGFKYQLITLEKNDPFSAMCSVNKGDEPIKITWKKNSIPIVLGHGTDIATTKMYSVLQIREVNENDAGNYTCVAENEAGKARRTVELEINISPEWINKPKNTNGSIGGDAFMDCKTDGYPIPTVTWYKLIDRKLKPLLSKSSRFNIFENGTLKIRNIQNSDTGQYSCIASNGIGSELMQYVTVKVKEFPLITFINGTTIAKVQENISFVCTISRNGNVSGHWLKLNKKMTNESRISITYKNIDSSMTVILHMTNLKETDSGKYDCLAINKQGQSSKNLMLIVEPLTVITTKESVLTTTIVPLFQSTSKHLDKIMQEKSQKDSSNFNRGNVDEKHVLPKNSDFNTNEEIESDYNLAEVQDFSFKIGNVNLKTIMFVVPGVAVIILLLAVIITIVVYVIIRRKNNNRRRKANREKDYSGIDTLNRSMNGKRMTPKSTLDRRYGKLESSSPIPGRIVENNLEEHYEIPDYFDLYHISRKQRARIWRRPPSEATILYTMAKWSVQVIVLTTLGQDIHATVYRCRASNIHGTIVSSPISVRATTKEQQQQIHAQVYDEYVVAGNIAVLKCHIPTFYKDDLEFLFIAENDMMVVYNGNLHISKVSSKKNLQLGFWCQLRNLVTGDTFLSQTAGKIILTDPQGGVAPVITDIMETVSVEKGDSVKLPCAAQGSPPPTYSWKSQQKDNMVNDGSNILVKGIEESGTYIFSCIVENRFGVDKKETEVIVRGIIQEVNSGANFELTCNVKGHPVKKIKWTLNGKSVKIGPHFEIVDHNVLKISLATRQHEGMYQCFVSNDLKEVQSTAQVILGDISPMLIETFKSRILQPGPSISLKCAATRNGTNLSKLIVKNIKAEDGGKYSCTARNDINSTTYTNAINVYGLPIVHQIKNVTVAAGRDTVIQCYVSGYPIQEIAWGKDGRFGNIPRNMDSSSKGLLVVKKARKRNNGKYSCMAKNGRGQTDEKYMHLKVLAQPVIAGFEYEILKMEENDPFSAMCSVMKGDEPITITWMKNSKPIVLGHGTDIATTKMYSVLQIREAQEHQAGNYSCHAVNEAGSDIRTVQLKINFSPKWIIEPTDTHVALGESILLNCKASGHPVPTVKWFTVIGRKVKPILNIDNRFQLLKNGSLLFKEIQGSDSGKYSCLVSNGVGNELIKDVNLEIKDIPKIKFVNDSTIVSAGEYVSLHCLVSGNQQVTMAWILNDKLIKPSRKMLVKKVYPLEALYNSNQTKGFDKTKVKEKSQKDSVVFKTNGRQQNKSFEKKQVKKTGDYKLAKSTESNEGNYGYTMQAILFIVPGAAVIILLIAVIITIVVYLVVRNNNAKHRRNDHCLFQEKTKKKRTIKINTKYQTIVSVKNSYNCPIMSFNLKVKVTNSAIMFLPVDDYKYTYTSRAEQNTKVVQNTIYGNSLINSNQSVFSAFLDNMLNTEIINQIFWYNLKLENKILVIEMKVAYYCCTLVEWVSLGRHLKVEGKKCLRCEKVTCLKMKHGNNCYTINIVFTEDQYRQDIHATVYKCMASNIHGSIISYPVSVKATTKQQQQQLQAQVYDEYVIPGNTAVLTCHIPPFYKRDLEIISWIREDNLIVKANSPKNGLKMTTDGKLLIESVESSTNVELGYWCQIKNKLTADTFLSQSAGQIKLTEHQGAYPSFSEAGTYTYSCIAQNKFGIDERKSTLIFKNPLQPLSYLHQILHGYSYGCCQRVLKVICTYLGSVRKCATYDSFCCGGSQIIEDNYSIILLIPKSYSLYK